MLAISVSVLMHRLPSLVFRHIPKQCYLPTARFSVFSFFRNYANKEETKEKYETDTMWLNSMQELERKTSLQEHSSPYKSLSRKQMRHLKKQAFLDTIDIYLRRYGKTRRGYRLFAKNALEKMPLYEVTDDLECYKAVIRLFPVGRMVAKTFLQAEFGHFQRQQDLMIDLLTQMHENHVIPDDEVGQMIIDIFGWRSHSMQQYRQLMYWAPKLANVNPWPVEWKILDDLDENPVRLALLIAERICADRNTEMHVVRLRNVFGSTSHHPQSMISAQSPEQRALLQYAINSSRALGKSLPAIYVDGPHFVWYQRLQAAYYTMWVDTDLSRIIRSTKRTVYRELIQTTTDVTNLPVFGHANPLLDAPVTPIALLASQSSNNTPVPVYADTEFHVVPVDQNASSLEKPSSRVPRCQAEYDNRWQVLRQSHSYNFIPSNLTVHEQGEGTILALGVVTPIADALIHQKTLYSGIIAKELDENNNESDNEFRKCPPVPAPAPLSLVRSWIKALQAQNPCLADATVVMRVSSREVMCESSERSSTDFVNSHTSGIHEQASKY